jgi:hypothetical protein
MRQRSQSFRALNKPHTISRSGWFDKALSEDDENSIHPAVEVVSGCQFKRRAASCQ